MPSIVEVEDDPVPLALIIAKVLRRNETSRDRAKLLAETKGNVAFRSATDPQAITIRFQRGRVRVERGADAGADMTITADLATMGDDGGPKPKVTGAAAHPRLALAVSKLLEPPLDPWPEEATRFWAFAAHHPGSPPGLKVVCLDDGHARHFGDPPYYEIHGSARRLQTLFSGGSVLAEDLLAGRLYAVGKLQHTAELTGRSLDWAMGR